MVTPTILTVVTVVAALPFVNPSPEVLKSPCPGLFTYKFLDIENHTWHGVLNLLPSHELHGIRVRILLDNVALELKVNKKSRTTIIETLDDKEFLVRDSHLHLKPGVPVPVSISVVYPPAGPVPILTAFRLNEVTKCSVTISEYSSPGNATKLTANDNVSDISSPIHESLNELKPPGQATLFSGSPATSQLVTEPSLHVNSFECGSVVPAFAPLIVDGQPSGRGQWPWHGAMYIADVSGLSYQCGMSLISPRHALTAAHCVTVRQHSHKARNPETLVLYFGKTYLDRWRASEMQEAQADKISIHPMYNGDTAQNDIALIRLAKPVRVTDWVRPVCIWEGDSKIELLVRKNGTIVGWGRTKTGEISNRLQHAEVPVIDPLDCIYSDPEFYSKYSSPKTFCAGVLHSINLNRRLPRLMTMSAWFPGWNRVVGFLTANVSSPLVRNFIRAAPWNKNNFKKTTQAVFVPRSSPDEVLYNRRRNVGSEEAYDAAPARKPS